MNINSSNDDDEVGGKSESSLPDSVSSSSDDDDTYVAATVGEESCLVNNTAMTVNSSNGNGKVGGKSESSLHASVSSSSDDILFSKSSLLHIDASVFSLGDDGDDDGDGDDGDDDDDDDTYEAATIAEKIIAFSKSNKFSDDDDSDDDDYDDEFEDEDELSTNKRTTSILGYSSSDYDSDEYTNVDDEFEDEPSTNKRTVSYGNLSFNSIGNLSFNSNDECHGSIPPSTSSKKISSRKSFKFVSFYRSSNKERSNDTMEGEHISNSRRKLLVDRENTVKTRKRRFTISIIAFCILFACTSIVLAILVTIYVIDPFEKPPDMSVPSASPNTVPSALYTPPLLLPVPAFEPTTIPPNKVIAEVNFLAYVPRGKGHWVTPESLEKYLTAVLEVLAPQILNEALEREDTDIARRLMSTQDRIIIAEPDSVDVDEVTCPPDAKVLDLCVKNSIEVALIYTAESFTTEYITDLLKLYESLLIKAIDDGSVREVDPSVILISYDFVGENTKHATEAPIINSEISTEQSIQPSLRESSVPTMIPAPTLSPQPTFGPSPAPSSTDNSESVATIPSSSPSSDTFEKPTKSPSRAPEASSPAPSAMESINLQTTVSMPLQSNVQPTFGPSPVPSSIDNIESVATIPSSSPSSDTFEKPTKSPSRAPESSSPAPSAMESINLQTTSSMPSQSNVFEEDVTSIPSSSNTLSENENVIAALSPTPSLTTSISPSTTTCSDENNACQAISESGECSMAKCDFWEREGKCSSNAPYMNQYCRKSCGLCGDDIMNLPPSAPPTASPTVPPAPCIDKKDDCAEWATLDQCDLSPIWMRQYCKYTCGLCDIVAKT